MNRYSKIKLIRRTVRLLVVFGLSGLLWWTQSALADDVAGALKLRRPTDVLSTRADPDRLLRNLAPLPERPIVPLTIEDAVAHELILHSHSLSEIDALRTAQALCEEARSLGYDPLLFLAMIRVESGFDHYAVSPVGAEGLMQLMPTTGAWVADKHGLQRPDGHTFDPVLNVRLGSRYLVQLHHEFGDLALALTAYNRGPANTRAIVRQFGGLPASVRDFYAGKVLRSYGALRAAYGGLPYS